MWPRRYSPLQHQASLFSIFSIVEAATFFAVVSAGGGVHDSPGFGLLSSVTVGAFLMRYQSIAAANFTAGAGLPGLCQVSLQQRSVNNSAVCVSVC